MESEEKQNQEEKEMIGEEQEKSSPMTIPNPVTDDLKYFSESTSLINRNLALAGIAIIWLFISKIDNNIYVLPQLLSWSLLLFSTSIVVDLFHYFRGYFALLNIKNKIQKNKYPDIDPFKYPRIHKLWNNGLLITKVFLTFSSYIFLSIFFINLIRST